MIYGCDMTQVNNVPTQLLIFINGLLLANLEAFSLLGDKVVVVLFVRHDSCKLQVGRMKKKKGGKIEKVQYKETDKGLNRRESRVVCGDETGWRHVHRCSRSPPASQRGENHPQCIVLQILHKLCISIYEYYTITLCNYDRSACCSTAEVKALCYVPTW